ncbi:sensor histidine kinase [Slackia equolifaciens]|uniref:histidine kinase n=1 Tax=Slackia equolifaciens TaxID=498718 RepID=A0A3N0B0L5_9ACTN|nr:histidine kinase dimerization/phospho-acceptor domain-containing protein [Slackia equolifaciens]RNL40652.1 sensor histidine kinase [Slackia equolifaciens]
MTARDAHDPTEHASVLSRLRRRIDKDGRRESTAGRRNPNEAHGQRSQTAAERRSKRARRKAAAPLFFGKQMLLFGALVAAVLVLDLFFYIGVALIENDASLTGGAPNHLAREAGQELEKTDDGWEMPDNVQAALDERGCWCILIGYDGEVAWHTPNAPESALRTYNLGDTAVFTRYGYLDDYPSFIWQRDDGLLVTCYPKGSYYPFATLYIPDQLVTRIPLYLLLMVVMDAAVFFAAYVISKRRVLKSVGPVVESLDKLAKGQSVHVGARGDLREVGESINAASAVIRRKDEARKRWVSGVSHDIRTPLAISMGHAERIATGEGVPEEARKSAETILRQSARIRDLVADLNIASKLEYDMQPLDVQPCALSKTVRSVAADYLNDGLDE